MERDNFFIAIPIIAVFFCFFVIFCAYKTIFFKWLKVRKYVKIKFIKYIDLTQNQTEIIDKHIDNIKQKEFEMMLKANNIKKI